jgi:hypothetical protein
LEEGYVVQIGNAIVELFKLISGLIDSNNE